MIELKTIQPYKAVSTSLYKNHIEDFVADFQTLCGRKLNIDATRWGKQIKSHDDKVQWIAKNLCHKCLIEIGVAEKVNSFYENVGGSRTLYVEIKLLKDLEVWNKSYKKGEVIYANAL